MTSGEFVSRCTADALSSAAQLLKDGGLVAFPTETVYGLGADATNAAAVARIYQAKGRPADHPLIVHIHSMQAMGEWADEIPDYAIALARNFWPGPMTLVLKRSLLAEDFVTGGQPTVGLRVPDHVVALALLSAFEKIGGKGIAAPSANRFGHVSPTTADAVREELANYLAPTDQTTVELNRTPIATEGFIALAEFETPESVIRLASPKTVEEFARVIYSALREADKKDLKTVVVQEPTGDGLALAIRDRLLRASKGR